MKRLEEGILAFVLPANAGAELFMVSSLNN
jgi:hypothetical protein